MNQVLTIHPDGTASGLKVKAGKGLDLRDLGKVAVKRVSEIIWSEDRQRWYVHFLEGPWAPKALTYHLWQRAGMGSKKVFDLNGIISTGSGLLTFEDYDDAVKAEVAFLDAMRLAGEFHTIA